MQREAVIRRHICFYGSVQGVGFRFTAQQLAGSLGLTGWVRNVDDYVEMEVQGRPSEIDRLISGLSANRWIQIDRMETEDMAVRETERRFSLEW